MLTHARPVRQKSIVVPMKYQANSFEMELPDGSVDRSNHILMLPGAASAGHFNVVVTREDLPPGIGLEQLVDAQVKAVEKTQKKYKVTQAKRVGKFNNEEGTELAAFEVGFSYESQGRPVSQRLVFVAHRAQQVLIFAGTLTGAWEDAQHKLWSEMLRQLTFKV
jgi:hypothetical protein